MSIVISCDSAEATAEWHARVSAAFPLVDVCVYPEVGDASAVEYALVWNHPTGRWSEFPNLRAILSLGAGVDRLAGDPTLPDVPVVRLHDPAMSHDIALYVLHYVIGHQRHLHAYRALQAGRRWQPRDNKTTEEYRVGILGAGNIGTHIGRTLHQMGFGVTAWRQGHMGSKPLEGSPQSAQPNDSNDSSEHGDARRKSPRTSDSFDVNFAVWSGRPALHQLVATHDAIISILPSTPATNHLLDAALFARMPSDSLLINVGRGNAVDDNALIDALNAGHHGPAHAVLDVFHHEPLPDQHPLWTHPQITLTPHISGVTRPDSPQVLDNLRKLMAGEPVSPLLDRKKGY